jgi:hypothetical protein
VVAGFSEKYEIYRDTLKIFLKIQTEIYQTWVEEINWRWYYVLISIELAHRLLVSLKHNRFKSGGNFF